MLWFAVILGVNLVVLVSWVFSQTHSQLIVTFARAMLLFIAQVTIIAAGVYFLYRWMAVQAGL